MNVTLQIKSPESYHKGTSHKLQLNNGLKLKIKSGLFKIRSHTYLHFKLVLNCINYGSKNRENEYA